MCLAVSHHKESFTLQDIFIAFTGWNTTLEFSVKETTAVSLNEAQLDREDYWLFAKYSERNKWISELTKVTKDWADVMFVAKDACTIN